MSKKIVMKILMIGPNPNKTLGGMSTVLKNYQQNNNKFYAEIIDIYTTTDGSKIKK